MTNIIEISGKAKSLKWKETIYPCNIGYGGITNNKTEGDKCTPTGFYPIREVMYRLDRIKNITSKITLKKIEKNFKWCDDPMDLNYNKFLKGQYNASCENLWRKDNLYDLLVVIGYNDSPVIPFRGSAIFIHCQSQLGSPTKGCISLKKIHLNKIIQTIDSETYVKIF